MEKMRTSRLSCVLEAVDAPASSHDLEDILVNTNQAAVADNSNKKKLKMDPAASPLGLGRRLSSSVLLARPFANISRHRLREGRKRSPFVIVGTVVVTGTLVAAVLVVLTVLQTDGYFPKLWVFAAEVYNHNDTVPSFRTNPDSADYE